MPYSVSGSPHASGIPTEQGALAATAGRKEPAGQEASRAVRRLLAAINVPGVQAEGELPTEKGGQLMLFARDADDAKSATIHYQNPESGETAGVCKLSAKYLSQMDKIELEVTNCNRSLSPDRIRGLSNETLVSVFKETMHATVHDANKRAFQEDGVPLERSKAVNESRRAQARLRLVCHRFNEVSELVQNPEVEKGSFKNSVVRLAELDDVSYEEGLTSLVKQSRFLSMDALLISQMSQEKQKIFFTVLEKHVNAARLLGLDVFQQEAEHISGAYHPAIAQQCIDMAAQWNKEKPAMRVELIMDWNNDVQSFANAFDKQHESFCNVTSFEFSSLNEEAMAAIAAHLPGGTVEKVDIQESTPGCLQIFAAAALQSDRITDITWSHNNSDPRSPDATTPAPAAADTADDPATAFSVLITREGNAIVRLSLARTPISSEGAEKLAEALANPHCRLEELNLRETRLDADGLSAIVAAAAKSPTLKKLDLTWLDVEFSSYHPAIEAALEKNPALTILRP